MKKQEKIHTIGSVIFIGFCLAIFYHSIICGVFLKLHYPFNTFLFLPAAQFSDFFDIVNASSNLNPYVLSDVHIPNHYFPGSFLFGYPFSLLHKVMSLGIYIIMLVAAVMIGNIYFLRNTDYDISKKRFLINIFIFSFLSFPLLFTFDRANFEGIIFFFSVLFLICYLNKKLTLAAICIAVATSFKVYPGVLMFLFLKNKHYKYFVLSSAVTLLIFLVSFVIFKGGFVQNFFGLITEMTSLKNNLSTTYEASLAFNSSLFASVRLLFIAYGFDQIVDIKTLFNYFNVTCLIVGFLLFIYLLRYQDSIWKITFLLVTYTIIFMPLSFHYKLIALFLPLWLFIENDGESKHDLLYCVLFGLLLIPMAYQFRLHNNYYDVAVVMKPVLLLAISYVIIVADRKPSLGVSCG